MTPEPYTVFASKDAIPVDIYAAIPAYESGELDEDETLALFGELVRTDLAWQLQGHYGRTAASLIAGGLLTPDGRVVVAFAA